MTPNFIIHPKGTDPIAIFMHGKTFVFDTAIKKLCLDRAQDIPDSRLNEENLSLMLAYSYGSMPRIDKVQKVPHILFAFQFAATQTYPKDSDLLPEKLCGVVFYAREDNNNFLLGNLCTSRNQEKQKIATYLMWAALQEIQDSLIVGNSRSAQIWLESSIGKEFYEKFGFVVMEEKCVIKDGKEKRSFIMATSLRASDELPSHWTQRETNEWRMRQLPRRTLTIPQAA